MNYDTIGVHGTPAVPATNPSLGWGKKTPVLSKCILDLTALSFFKSYGKGSSRMRPSTAHTVKDDL